MASIRRFAAGALAFFASVASGAEYYWQLTTGSTTHFASALAACSTVSGAYPGAIYSWASPTLAQCGYIHPNGTTQSISRTVSRFGDSCPANTTYNTTTGGCDSPQAGIGELCADQTGGTTRDPKVGNSDGTCKNVTQSDQAAKCQYLAKNRPSHKVTFMVTDWQKDAGSSTAPDAGYVGSTFGCEVQVLEGSTCTYEPPRPSLAPDANGEMEPGVHRCTADAIITGAVNENSTADPAGLECLLNPDVCEIPDPTQQKDAKPCAYAWDTDGQRGTCQSVQVDWKSEGESCDFRGSVNGESVCVGKKPTSNGIVIDTEVKTTANADGTTTQTKTDKATQTVCNGSTLNSCNTYVTNNKTTVVKNADGTTKSENSTCSGANCPTSTNPDGNGDGLGDCVGDDCGEEGGSSAPPEMPELEEVDEFGDSTSAYYARIRNAPIVQAVTSISVPSGGTCPTGVADTFMGAISFDSFCQLAPQVLAGLVWLFRAIWAWAAIRLFFTA